MLPAFPRVDGEGAPEAAAARAPSWIETVRVHFPRFNRDADELCVTHPADVIWAVQMSTVEFHPWNSRREDVEKPDEWRIDLDPMPVARYADVQQVAVIVQELLAELGAVGYPKTSGGKGLHVYVRIPPEHGHPDVRRAAWAFAREVERRSDGLVDLTWWRKDRDPASIFVDYNQNARDHTIASATPYVAPGRWCHPDRWDEIATLTRATSPSPPCPPVSELGASRRPRRHPTADQLLDGRRDDRDTEAPADTAPARTAGQVPRRSDRTSPGSEVEPWPESGKQLQNSMTAADACDDRLVPAADGGNGRDATAMGTTRTTCPFPPGRRGQQPRR